MIAVGKIFTQPARKHTYADSKHGPGLEHAVAVCNRQVRNRAAGRDLDAEFPGHFLRKLFHARVAAPHNDELMPWR